MLSYKEKELIKDYLIRHNLFNLKDLCNYLMDNGASKETYSTGKPKIFPYAAVYIKSYIPGIEMKRHENNILYEIKGELPVNTEMEEEVEPKEKNTPSKIGQLSLF
ncbi:DUF3895 domain-containing protein [Alkalihalobacillus sp. BA299]|uniref:DUF3895 domain-containing protein n=1 Tax=Alkalihalobacillus sp. BA299 TaxID=2815938 RepID=UPI001ADA423C|nr:DUF3895 domain-containing protein [Alkalihalobacillus sp. BA299]